MCSTMCFDISAKHVIAVAISCLKAIIIIIVLRFRSGAQRDAK